MYSSEHNKPIFYEDYGKQNGNKEKNTHRSKRAKFQNCKMKIKQHHKLGSIIEDAAFFEQLARNPGLGTAGPQVADLRGTAEDKEWCCKTIHRFHNRFSQSQRRPLLGVSKFNVYFPWVNTV